MSRIDGGKTRKLVSFILKFIVQLLSILAYKNLFDLILVVQSEHHWHPIDPLMQGGGINGIVRHQI